MKQDLFRKVSLDRLSSPEQLDQLINVTTPRAWFTLLGVGLVLLATVIWGIGGSIPDRTHGQGILINSGGVYNIVHSSAGQITDIRVRKGDVVKRGEVMARVDQPDLVNQIIFLKNQLEKMKAIRETQSGSEIKALPPDLYDLVSRIESARANQALAWAGDFRDLNEIQLQLELAKVQAGKQEDLVSKMTLLIEQGAILDSDLISAKKELELYKLQVENNTMALSVLEHHYQEKIGMAKKELELLESQLEAQIFQTEDDISKLQNELEIKSVVVSPVEGRVLEVKINHGDMVQPGMQLISLEREGQSVKLEAVMYVRAEEGKKIIPGMEVQLSPTTVNKEEYGYMLGRVINVSEYPTTLRSMALTLGSEELASQLAGNSAPLEITVDLITDEKTLSGYKWSSANGPPLGINSGTLCTGAITISEHRPIQMVIPALKKVLFNN